MKGTLMKGTLMKGTLMKGTRSIAGAIAMACLVATPAFAQVAAESVVEPELNQTQQAAYNAATSEGIAYIQIEEGLRLEFIAPTGAITEVTSTDVDGKWQSGESFIAGSVWRIPADSAVINLMTGRMTIFDEPVIVFINPDEPLLGPNKSCSVSCGEGYYSCCNAGGAFGSATCVCFTNGTVTQTGCESGGPGSTDCSVGIQTGGEG